MNLVAWRSEVALENESEDVPELVLQELEGSDDEVEDEEGEESVPTIRRSTRISKGVLKPEKYT
jgi:hypothetical protein